MYVVVGSTFCFPLIRPRLMADPMDNLIFMRLDTLQNLNNLVRLTWSIGISLVTLKGILVHLLQNYGFEVSEKDDILTGEKADQLISLGFTNECSVGYIENFRSKLGNTTSSKIIASMIKPLPGVYEYAEANGITLWDSEDIEKEIGGIIFDHVNDHGGSTILQFAEMVRAEIVDGKDFDNNIPVTIESIGTGDTEAIQVPILHLDDVKEISQKTVKGFKYELELVPHFIFEYLCIFRGKENAERKYTGLLLINAYTGIASKFDGVPDITDNLDIPHIRIEPKIDEHEASSMAMFKVIELNTEFDDVIIEKEHTIITERTEFKPKEEDITLSLKGVISVPVWCVEGTNGVMIINAANGKVVSEEYYSNKE